MSMRKPLTYSAVVHIAIVIATIYGLPARKLEPVESKVLPVELLTVADVTNLKRLAKKLPPKPKPVEQPTPPEPKPEPEKPKPAPAPEKPEPTPPEPEEKAEPIPDKEAEKPKPEEKKPEPPKPEKKKPTPEKPAEKKKPKFDPNDIAALLNKQPKTSSEPAEAQESDKDINVEDQDDPTMPMTVSQIDALKQKINQCYDAGFLAGSQDADKLYAIIEFELAEDGSLKGVPSIGSTGPGASGQLAVLARKAIVQCAPYDKLPKDNYGAWKEIEAKFSVQGML
ncbi:MAG: hypothetical protein Q7S99_00385 [Parvibaculum sp.]|nr:hypothetical protein [Parvibaculum sp.]